MTSILFYYFIFTTASMIFMIALFKVFDFFIKFIADVVGINIC